MTFEKAAAQGDLYIMRADDHPDDLIETKQDGGQYIVAHSETGHHHVLNPAHCTVKERPVTSDPVLRELFVDVHTETEVRHLRSFDTHAPIRLSPGKYVFRNQREYTPEGYRRAAD